MKVSVKNDILALLGDCRMRLTPSALEREICSGRLYPSRKLVRTIIKEMVAEGLLLYTNHFNTTHLELNYSRPNQVSDRIFLVPNLGQPQNPNSSALCIRLDQGGSFGFGDHPTTRLALQGVDFVMQRADQNGPTNDFRALDIGTGSGVLAMAAVGLGASGATGIDTDPAALYEAAGNVALNGMTQKITLMNSMDDLDDARFALVMANLRPPTLKSLMPAITAKSIHHAYWVLSGYRDEEMGSLVEIFPAVGCKIIWQGRSCGWSALAARYSA